jgi:hypothetical protein
MVKTFCRGTDGRRGGRGLRAPYGQPSEDRVNHRNGHRERRWDTRAGTRRSRRVAAMAADAYGVAGGSHLKSMALMCRPGTAPPKVGTCWSSSISARFRALRQVQCGLYRRCRKCDSNLLRK